MFTRLLGWIGCSIVVAFAVVVALGNGLPPIPAADPKSTSANREPAPDLDACLLGTCVCCDLDEAPAPPSR